ncbi:hypothetical protein K438DRAFT_2023143, partial [Mycena galopus ATCC 62051]
MRAPNVHARQSPLSHCPTSRTRGPAGQPRCDSTPLLQARHRARPPARAFAARLPATQPAASMSPSTRTSNAHQLQSAEVCWGPHSPALSVSGNNRAQWVWCHNSLPLPRSSFVLPINNYGFLSTVTITRRTIRFPSLSSPPYFLLPLMYLRCTFPLSISMFSWSIALFYSHLYI